MNLIAKRIVLAATGLIITGAKAGGTEAEMMRNWTMTSGIEMINRGATSVEKQFMESQMILNTGARHTGILFAPFSTTPPSEQGRSGQRRAPISSGDSGWADAPDKGGTSLSSMPVGEPWIMILYAALFSAGCYLRSKKKVLSLAALLISVCPLQASTDAVVSGLSLSASDVISKDSVTVTPTFSPAPTGETEVCWGVYYDAACTRRVAGTTFRQAEGNSVRFAAPDSPGTYHIKIELHDWKNCHKVPFTSRTETLHVYPGDAGVVLTRAHQQSGIQTTLAAPDGKKQVYGIMRFDKDTLNDEDLSLYRRFNYFISFPFDVQVSDISGFGNIGAEWRILFYDGLGRAENGYFAERTTNWVMIDDTDSVLHAKQGYLLQLNYERLAATNTAFWGDAEQLELYFPAKDPISAISTVNETIAEMSDAYECHIDLSATLGEEGDRTAKDSYWRCIGVPSFTKPAGVSGMPFFYEWDAEDNSLDVRSSDGFTFLPLHAYLIQNGNAIEWKNVSKPSVAALRREGTSETVCLFRLDLAQGESSLDRTYIRFTDDENVTEAFDFGHDLSKEMNEGANIYTRTGYERLAGNSLPVNTETTVVPVGIWAETAGEYTFLMPEGTHDIGVTLIDMLTETRTDMAEKSYTVSLEAGRHDTRFALEIEAVGEAPTGLEERESGHEYTAAYKEWRNGILYIVRDGKRYDARGWRIQ